MTFAAPLVGSLAAAPVPPRSGVGAAAEPRGPGVSENVTCRGPFGCAQEV
jgi:hypothetical protein